MNYSYILSFLIRGLCSPSGLPHAHTKLFHWNWRSYQGFGLGTTI
jgi:hypothetical protein